MLPPPPVANDNTPELVEVYRPRKRVFRCPSCGCDDEREGLGTAAERGLERNVPSDTVRPGRAGR